MEPLIGTIILFAGNFAPVGWAFCNGQILPIAQNTALFSLLGTTYGGNGQTTFALPDLRGRVPVSAGQGPGLADYRLGATLGTETVTLTVNEMPSHNHKVFVSNNAPDNSLPNGDMLGRTQIYTETESSPLGTLSENMIGLTGGSLPHNNMQPTLALNYIIAMVGIFPSRP